MLLGYIDQLFAANFAYRDTKGLFPEWSFKREVCSLCIHDEGTNQLSILWLNNAHKILMKSVV